MSYTDPVTWIAGNPLPAGDLNTYLRDNLRWLHDRGADLASAATITPTTQFHKVTGTTTIDNVASPVSGHEVVLWITGTLTIRNNGGGTGNIRTATGADKVVSNGMILVFRSDGTVWQEVTAAPAISCRVTHSANQTTAATLALAFDTETYDVGGLHDTATNNTRITIPASQTGRYQFNGTLTWTAGSTVGVEGYLRKNGATKLSTFGVARTTGEKYGLVVADMIDLVAGDYVEWIVVAGGITVTLNGGAGEMQLSVRKLG